jgi:hypothetical protein
MPGIRFALAAAMLFVFACLTSPALAQSDPIDAQGLKPYGAYHGGEFDLISLENGKLDLHIPLFSYPQRGGSLKMGFTLRYSNPTVYVRKVSCPPPTYNCTYAVAGSPGVLQITPDFGLNLAEDTLLVLLPIIKRRIRCTQWIAQLTR